MIQLKNLTLRRGAKVVLDGASATVNPGEKVGLVGRNGAGKSSLFALLAGTLHEDGGDFSIPPTWRMAQVAQEMPETDQGATAFVLDGDVTLAAARREVEAAEDSNDGERMAHAYMAMQDAGANDAPARAQALLLGLGFAVDELDRPVDSFSGGWRMRLQLARALMCPSELLLLDEPTNHLDLDALVWLESWLKRYEGTMLVISHDREFLDAITGVTLHIERGKLTRYGGNYSRFEEMRAEQMALQDASYSRQQEKIAHLQKFIDRFKAKASKAKQAQSRVKALERMEKIGPVLAEADFTFEFIEPANLPNPMLSLTGVAVGYPGADGAEPTVIVRGIDRSVLAGQRIGILGANGQGKSTLVKTIARELAAIEGTITEGKGLNIGYFAQQELDVLRPQDTPLEHMIRLAREIAPQAREQELRTFLGSFNFTGDMVRQTVGSMSGGEKARLVLCMIVWQRPNLLLLDEPTNHLDLATREALSVALNEFEGTVMLVSHDRALLRTVCDEFWLVSRGGVEPFDGDLDDYQRYLLEEAKRVREAAQSGRGSQSARAQQSARGPQEEPPPSAGQAAEKTAGQAGGQAAGQAPGKAVAQAPALSAAEQRRLDARNRQEQAARMRPIKREIDTLDKWMSELQAGIAALAAQLAGSMPPSEIAEAGRRLKALEAELADAENRWLTLNEKLEALQA